MIVIATDKGAIGKFLVIVRAGGQSSTRPRCHIWKALNPGSPLTGRTAFLHSSGGMRDRHYWVYILASRVGGTLYIGVTSDLERRVYEHREGGIRGFTSRYGITRLIYYEQFDDAENAIRREKRLKKWNRAWKIRLIEENSPCWVDLYPTIAGS